MLGTIRSVILCVGVTLVRRVFKYQFTHLSIQIFYSNIKYIPFSGESQKHQEKYDLFPKCPKCRLEPKTEKEAEPINKGFS